MFYSTVIFKQAGLTTEGAVYATIGMGTVNSTWYVKNYFFQTSGRVIRNLPQVDHPKFGRRSLMLMGLTGMWASTILLVIALSLGAAGHQWASYGAILFVLLFVISFATGPGRRSLQISKIVEKIRKAILS
ncbi:unnamed protein product [Cylicostephanus goldi]|uniref:Uncharacterized protein n=1 Tax=Cylicostephanus goldi TaxID=71465 RepID=A0A3P6SLG6_CYLGO|nr:unnamed protein product [Cylicostephanus goldi]